MLFNVSEDNLVGTEAYISPEAIHANKFESVSFESDLWSLGVIFWQLFSSDQTTPFQGKDQIEVFEDIRNGKYEMADQAPCEVADLIESLLIRRPCERLGSASIEDLKNHPVFAQIDFNQIYQRKLQAPLRPRQIKLSL